MKELSKRKLNTTLKHSQFWEIRYLLKIWQESLQWINTHTDTHTVKKAFPKSALFYWNSWMTLVNPAWDGVMASLFFLLLLLFSPSGIWIFHTMIPLRLNWKYLREILPTNLGMFRLTWVHYMNTSGKSEKYQHKPNLFLSFFPESIFRNRKIWMPG